MEVGVLWPVRAFDGVSDARGVEVHAEHLGPPVVPGNRVTTLLNGDQAFPAMLEAIRSARHSITLEAYGRSIPEA